MNASTRRVLDYASQEVGYLEDGGNKSKFNREYYGSDVGADWCGVFIWKIFDATGYGYLAFGSREDSRKAVCEGVRNWMTMAKTRGLWVTGNYQPGDVILFDWEGNGAPNHIGIVEYVEGNQVHTIEGNTKGDGMVREGVARKVRSAYIMGAFRPNYPIEEEDFDDVEEEKPNIPVPNSEFKTGDKVRVRPEAFFDNGAKPIQEVFEKVYILGEDTIKVGDNCTYFLISPTGTAPWTGRMSDAYFTKEVGSTESESPTVELRTKDSVKVKPGSKFIKGETPLSFVFKKVYVLGPKYEDENFYFSPNGKSPWTGIMNSTCFEKVR